MKRHYHSIEDSKNSQRSNYFKNARKSKWEDLSALQTQKLQGLLTLAEMVSLYQRKDHDKALQELLDNDSRFQALLTVAIRDINIIKGRIEKLGTEHAGKVGSVTIVDLPEMLKLSESYLSMDDLIFQLQDTVVSELSDIFSAHINTVKQATTGLK